MDFKDTPEEAAFRAEATAWLSANADSRNARARRGEDWNIAEEQAWQAKKADAGWACLTWPEEYGGRAASAIQNVIWNQEEAKVRPGMSIFAIGQGMLGPTIMVHGTDEQKQRHLKPMLRGEEIWCQLFSEPAAGSDVAGLRMTAVEDGHDWVVNGQKIWTTGAHFCKWGCLVARTEPDAVKHAGITYFIIDMESPGIEIRQIRQIDGGAAFNEVFFNDVRIPDTDRLGAVNDGWRCIITTLMNERASIGGAEGRNDVETLLRLARETDCEGEPAIADSAVRQRLANFYIRAKGLQYTTYRSLTALSRGSVPGPESSIGKLVSAPLAQEMATFALDLLGEAGAVNGDEAVGKGLWQASYLASPGLRIAGGTDEIMRNILAERVLGLPPEMRADKGLSFREIPTGADR